MKCLGLWDSDEDVAAQISDLYEDLRKNILLANSDLYAAIIGLEDKIDNDLLDETIEELEITKLTDQVDSFLAEFTSLSDSFHTAALEDFIENETRIDAIYEENQDVLDNFEQRIGLYIDMEEDYDQFIKDTSLAGVLAGPSLQKLIDIGKQMLKYYASKFERQFDTDVLKRISIGADGKVSINALEDQANDEFVEKFSAYVDELYESLYPSEKLEAIHSNILTVRAAYTVDDGAAHDCRALANNSTIEKAVPLLQENMNEIVDALQAGVGELISQGASSPADDESLREGTLDAMMAAYEEISEEVIDDYRVDVFAVVNTHGGTIFSSTFLTQDERTLNTIRTFLESQYLAALKIGKGAEFQELLTNVKGKIDVMLDSGIASSIKAQVRLIEDVVDDILAYY